MMTQYVFKLDPTAINQISFRYSFESLMVLTKDGVTIISISQVST